MTNPSPSTRYECAIGHLIDFRRSDGTCPYCGTSAVRRLYQ
jgi:hypothetical protein